MSATVHHPGVRDHMTVRFRIDNARSAKILSMTTYKARPVGPNTPANVPPRFVLAATTSWLTIKHTGPGNLWQATSYKANFIRAAGVVGTRQFKSIVNTRACNSSGTAHTFTFIHG